MEKKVTIQQWTKKVIILINHPKIIKLLLGSKNSIKLVIKFYT